MVAKFREKCAMAEKTLQWLIKTTNSRQSAPVGANELKIVPAVEGKTMTFASPQSVNTDDDILVECVSDTIDDHPEYMIIENDDTTAESDDARIEMSSAVEESADEFIQEVVEEDGAPKVQYCGDPKAQVVINHSCEYCGAGFAQANNLLRHMQTHALTEDISK